MRVTGSSSYNNFINDQQSIKTQFKKLNQQISSGMKIKYGHEDPSVFNTTLRLDYEEHAMDQAIDVSKDAQNFANNTDNIMFQFSDAMNRFKTLLVQASNDTNGNANYDAIAKELKGLKKHMIDLGNSSINGQFLFSGTKTDIRPLDSEGHYLGNGEEMKVVTGAGVEVPYNLPGKDLFLGSDIYVQKKITTNVTRYNQEKLFPVDADKKPVKVLIEPKNTILELTGDIKKDNENRSDTWFYLQGRRGDGTTVKTKFSLTDQDTVQTLLDKIGESFGNTPIQSVVDVSMQDGHIVVQDRRSGESFLDFHLVAATDIDTSKDEDGDGLAGNDADVTSIDTLNKYAKTLEEIKGGSGSRVILTTFVSDNSKGVLNDRGETVRNELAYDRTYFEQNGSDIKANVSQLLKRDILDSDGNIIRHRNDYATESDKLVDASGVDTLVTQKLKLETSYYKNAQISFENDGVHVVLDSTDPASKTFDILDLNGDPVLPDSMTFRQLNDAVGMVLTDNIPDTTIADPSLRMEEYRDAAATAKQFVDVNLDDRGRMWVHEKGGPSGKYTMALYDAQADQFVGFPDHASVMVFNTANALTIDSPEHDLFSALDDAIEAVQNGFHSPDGKNNTNPRNIGMQNVMERIDHVVEHISREHTSIGAISNRLKDTVERSEALKINIRSLRSDVLDTDIAEATMKLNQLSLNFQAMMATIAKVQKLSLVNYI